MNAEKKFEDMLVTPKLILRWIREGDVYVNRLGEDEMESCKLQVEAALARPEQPMSPEHLPKYIATNGVKPMEGGGGGGSQPEQTEWRKGFNDGYETAIEQFEFKALKEAENQEPVAWLVSDAQGRYATIRDPAPYGEEVYEPLYAAPPSKQWVGLTDDEIDWIFGLAYADDMELLRTIEAKLKEKNNG